MRFFVAIVLVAWCASASAVYKCKGKDGQFVYSDTPCPTAHESVKIDGVPLEGVRPSAKPLARRSGRDAEPDPGAPAPPEAAPLMDIYRRWIDAERLAGSTARIALSGPVASLQELKRQASTVSVPECVQEARSNLAQLLSKSADSYLAFMRKEDLTSTVFQIVDRSALVAAFENQLAYSNCR